MWAAASVTMMAFGAFLHQPEKVVDKAVAHVAATATVKIRVVDELGKGVPGAVVGTSAHKGDGPGESSAWMIGFFGEDDVTAPVTDGDGVYVALGRTVFYGEEDQRTKPIVAWTPDRSRVGLAKLQRADMGGEVTVKVEPACRVVVKSRSTGLDALGRPLKWANAYVYWGELRPFGCSSTAGTHEFVLPPGKFRLHVYGTETSSVNVEAVIAPGDKEKTFEVDLPPDRLAHMVGKPAPELREIKGWKNAGGGGEAVTLESLKGKVVLLDFWGYWCGPCVHSMPELMALHEQYKDKGLVIIAVHDDSVASIAEMDEKLASIKEKVWGGKDLPFLVALDGGGERPIEGQAGSTARGATTAAYGITAFPTQVLIDREGKVVGRARKGEVRRLLEGLNAK